ncbi:Stringent starvation protein B [hydrothermal vent metagenome]|uniref:Stringent starvation protein B n=1 Tax=hydrothermal vent metagenome TaxID=652676 RepID=A0A1W1CTC0_9ZZZZ
MVGSVKPYLVRGLYQWIIDNKFTPYLLVDCSYQDLKLPKYFLEQDEVILNISETAVKDLVIDNEFIGFSARFEEQSFDVFIIMDSIKSIYAYENNEGMWFETNSKEEFAKNNVEQKSNLRLV